ncbi:MAG: VWA domain-containing protein [Candidatus Dormibacteraeota bacterium]|nr:VWA domain-containing protein [Candidatus Dormibacteraeota bacterium]
MSFQQPALLFALLAIPVLSGLYVLAQRRRRKYALRFTDVSLLASVVGRRPAVRRHIPPALFLLGATALVVAMAQPVLNLEVARNDASVMLVIDTSGSMDASDVSPTRLDAAKKAAHNLIDQLPSNSRVGLIGFSTYPIVASTLTENRDTVLSALDALQAGGGTATGDALALAVKEQTPARGNPADGGRPPTMIVLLTDGVTNRGSDPLQVAQQSKAASIPIQAIGVGSRDPSVMVHGQPVGGVDEQALSQIASTTGGKYYFAEESGKLGEIYSTLGSQFAWRFVRFDVTVPAVIAGAVAVLLAAMLSLWWFRVLP